MALPNEKNGYFLSENKNIGLFVFIHGGYWRAFDKSSWSPIFRCSGEAGLLRQYQAMIMSRGKHAQITEDIARCITFLTKSERGSDSARRPLSWGASCI